MRKDESLNGAGSHPRVPRPAMVAVLIARWSAQYPWRVLAAAAVLFFLSLVSLSRLHVSSSLTVMLGKRSASAAAMERVGRDYQALDALMLLVELPATREADPAGRQELLDFGARLERAILADPTAAPLIDRVRYGTDPSLERFARDVILPHGGFYLSDEGMTELLRRLEPGSMREQFVRNEAMVAAPGPAGVALSGRVLRDPLRLFELIPTEMNQRQESSNENRFPDPSTDQRSLLVHIGSTAVGNDYAAGGRLVDSVLRASAVANTTGLRVEVAGPAAIARESARVIRRDAVVSCVVSIGLLYGLFFLFYRRWFAGLLIGGVAAVGMVAGIGVLALRMTEVSPLAAMIAALLAGLGTDYGIHFVSHYQGYREKGMASEDAVAQTAEHMALPIVTNCFTSIFGFISLWPSEIQMLSDFAVMGTAGLVGALIAVFALMPAALVLIDRSRGYRTAERAGFGALADVVASRPRLWMSSALSLLGVAIIAGAFHGFQLRFESDLTVMHPRPNRALEATGRVLQTILHHGDVIPVEVSAMAPEGLLGAAHDAARAFSSAECRAAGVMGVAGLPSLLPDPRLADIRKAQLERIDVERALNSFDAALEASAFDATAYSDYRSFLRDFLSARNPPTMEDLLRNPEVAEKVLPASTAGAPPTRTLLLVHVTEPLHDRAQRRTTITALNRAAASVRGGSVTVAGIAAVAEDLEAQTRAGLLQSVGISVFLVLGWLALVFRRPADVLLALVPLFFAACTTVLFIIATGQKFNPINSVAIPLLDGIAVDAGVFLVSTFRSHGSTRRELRLHLRSTTHAVLLAVATTVTAFLALCFTHTPAIRSLGLVSAVGIVASGIGAVFLLLPLLLRRVPEHAA